MLGLEKLFSNQNTKTIKALEPIVAKINALEPDIIKLTDDELKAKTKSFKKELEEGKMLDDILPEAFAVVREASRRTLGQRHFDVQILGGIILHQWKYF
jgi:preprotein translocase subunit SecA